MKDWVLDYNEMNEIIKGLQELGYPQAKSSSIMDRGGDYPAVTVYFDNYSSADSIGLFDTIKELGYTPLAPIRPMKLKSGKRGIKFSVRRIWNKS